MINNEKDELTITRDITRKECHWLTRDIKKGETCYLFHGCTYGCVGHEGTAVEFEDMEGFKEVPNDAIKDENDGCEDYGTGYNY